MRPKWDISKIHQPFDRQKVLSEFETFLSSHGYRRQSVQDYLRQIDLYLRSSENPDPSPDDAQNWFNQQAASDLARATVNQRRAALMAFYRSKGIELKLPYLKPNKQIPLYFDESDINRFFDSIQNMKHYAMFYLMFFCLLRASDLCGLTDEDLDLPSLTLRIREGKGGKDALLPIPPGCRPVLEAYLSVRPPFLINGIQYLFYTDWGNPFCPNSLRLAFHYWKKRAGITKPGGVHVFGRHSPASLAVKNGIDIYSLQMLMRHSDIKTTARYLHTSIAVLREKQIFLELKGDP